MYLCIPTVSSPFPVRRHHPDSPVDNVYPRALVGQTVLRFSRSRPKPNPKKNHKTENPSQKSQNRNTKRHENEGETMISITSSRRRSVPVQSSIATSTSTYALYPLFSPTSSCTRRYLTTVGEIVVRLVGEEHRWNHYLSYLKPQIRIEPPCAYHRCFYSFYALPF